MRVKETCPSCGSPVAPDDLLCANCELILDAKRIPDAPTGSDISVVRRMLERPQTGVPSAGQPDTSKRRPEKPTKVFPRSTKVTRVPIVVASLTRKMGQLNELEAYVASFIDGEHDVVALSQKSGVALHEVNVVLQSLNDKMVIDFADDPDDEVKPTVEGSSPSIKFDPAIFNVPESKPRLEPLSFLPTKVTESRLAAHEADAVRLALQSTDEIEPKPLETPTDEQDAASPRAAEPSFAVTPRPSLDTATTQLLEPVPEFPAMTQPMKPVRSTLSDAPPTELAIPILPEVSETEPRASSRVGAQSNRPAAETPARELARVLEGIPTPAPSPPPRNAPSASPPPHVRPPPAPSKSERAPATNPPTAAPSAPARSGGALAPAPEVVLPPPASRPRRVLKPASMPPGHGTAPTPAEGTPIPSAATSLDMSSGVRPTVQLALDQLPFDADEAPAAPVAPPVPSRPPATLIDPDLQKLKHAGRPKPTETPSLPSVIVAELPSPTDRSGMRTPPEPVEAAPVDPQTSIRTPPQPLEPVRTNVTPAIPLEPVRTNITPAIPLEPVNDPPPSRPRRKLPPGTRRSSGPLPPPEEKRTTPVDSPPAAVALGDAPVTGTDPRIVSKGQANRRVLDALKQVKRRAGDGAEEVKPEPAEHGTRADRLAAGTLQVAIRMEQNGRLDEAVRYLEAAISKSPDAPTLYNRLAIIMMREHGDLVRAEHLLQKAMELAPDNPVYEKNLQAVLQKRAMKG